LGTLEGIAFFFDQVVHVANLLDVVIGVTSVAFFVFFGANDVKFPFPKANQRSRYFKLTLTLLNIWKMR
jgi:hypothetical protein